MRIRNGVLKQSVGGLHFSVSFLSDVPRKTHDHLERVTSNLTFGSIRREGEQKHEDSQCDVPEICRRGCSCFATPHAKPTSLFFVMSGRRPDQSNITFVWDGGLAAQQYYVGLGWPAGQSKVMLLWSWVAG